MNTIKQLPGPVGYIVDKVFFCHTVLTIEDGRETRVDGYEKEMHLSFRRVAVEARLGCSVPSSFPMVSVNGELEIHYFAFELQGGLKGGRGDHSDEVRNGREPENGLGLRASGAIK